ncbi:MAG TPA: SGNH/GDSL hydrolase family protein [Nitrospiraceae bacterium]|nr:SGNH/GDSL hydrolase family protein [Nitrospiraceae bacterium]
MRRVTTIIIMIAVCLSTLACVKGPRDKKIEFIYLALGASDAAGVGALPTTEGYVFLIKSELDRRRAGVALLNLGVPGARIDLIKEQVRLAAQTRIKANFVTVWTGGNDLVHGDDPKTFQEDLRFLLQTVRDQISEVIIVANLPDLTRLPRFRRNPDAFVTLERVRAFNRAIEQEASAVRAPVVDLFAQPIREDLIFDMDGFHPNDAGHRELAKLFLGEILVILAGM